MTAPNCSPATGSFSSLLLAAAFSLGALALPAPAGAQPHVGSSIARLASENPEIAAFYAARQYRPLWVRGSSLGPEADILLDLLRTAEADGRDPDRFLRLGVREAVKRARAGDRHAPRGAGAATHTPSLSCRRRRHQIWTTNFRHLGAGTGSVASVAPSATIFRDVGRPWTCLKFVAACGLRLRGSGSRPAPRKNCADVTARGATNAAHLPPPAP